MNLVDSSAWIAYFSEEKNAKQFAKVIENTQKLIIPTIVLYEVAKKIFNEFDEKTAAIYTGHIKRGRVVDLDNQIALRAAQLSCDKKMAMADSIILATAQTYNATVWTQDVDFKGIKGVKYFKK